jgi:excisionase family DNA binding protein
VLLGNLQLRRVEGANLNTSAGGFVLEQLQQVTVSVDTAGQCLGISRGYAYELARSGRLPGVRRLGRRYLVVTHELKQFLGLNGSAV